VVRFWSQYQTKVGNYNALEARAVVVATTFLRSGGAEDTAALRAALQPLSKRAQRRLANTLAGEIIKN
jgi:hypothetical protein